MRRAAYGAASVVLIGAGAFLMATPAQAALLFPFDNQLALPGEASFGEVSNNGIAVDDSNGKTYVAQGEKGVSVFETSTTTQLADLDGSSTPSGSFGARQLAVAADNSSGRVYVLDSVHNLVDEFSPAGAFLCQISGKTPVSTEEKEAECNGATGSDTPSHGLSAPSGIAVGQASGEIYVGDAGNGAIDVFGPAGAYLRQISLAPLAAELSSENTHGLAVDDKNGDLYFSNGIPPVVFVFDATGGAHLTTWTGANTTKGHFGGVERFGGQSRDIGEIGVAADNSSGRVYVTSAYGAGGGSESAAVTDVFAAGGEYLVSRFGLPSRFPQGPAVDQATGRLYLEDNNNNQRVVESFGPALVLPDVITKAASEVKPHEATLQGSVNPDEIALTECLFEWGETESYGHSAECEPNAATIGAGNAPVAVKAKVEGLQIGTTYHYRLVAKNANGKNEGEDRSLETPPPPSIDAAVASEVTATSAKLSAEVNPRGSTTSCRIEWGPTAEPGNPALPYENSHSCEPEEELGSGSSDVPVSLRLEGLSKNTPYHWRLIATNPSGTTTGAEHTFVFLSPPPHQDCPANEAFRSGDSANLPDCRAYEMVTPAFKNGALVGTGGGLTNFPFSFSEDGSRLIAPTIQCFAAASSCPGKSATVGSYVALSRAPGGWLATPLGPPPSLLPHYQFTGLTAESPSALFTAPAPPSEEFHFYLRAADGSLADVGPITPPELGHRSQGPILSATVGYSHIVFGLYAHSPEQIWPFDQTDRASSEYNLSIYEYVGTANSKPFLVGVSGPRDSTDLISRCGTTLGGAATFFPGQLSADGRTVYFTARGGPGCFGSGANAATAVPADQLYARLDGETAQPETLDVSKPQCGPGEGAGELACRNASPGDAAFLGASRDGARALFADTHQLTDDASEDANPGDTARQTGSQIGCRETSGSGCNLYLYDASRPEGQRLSDLTAAAPPGEGPRFRAIFALSADASHVYFIAASVLTAGPNPEGNQPTAGADNLYLYRADAAHPSGALTFIATLPEGDHAQWEYTEGNSTNLTPDGRFLVFLSAGRLTPDTGAAGVDQVFRYDAQSEALTRISVGERGYNDNGNDPVHTHCVSFHHCSEGAEIASFGEARSFLPGYTRTDPTMSHDGSRVFFTSPLALTPGALDQVPLGEDEFEEPAFAENVYEWEQDGHGSCAEAGGCVRLISDGRDLGSNQIDGCFRSILSASCLLGVDASGENVFLTSTDQLVPADTDTQVDVYDARIGGGLAESAGIEPCQGDACPGPGTAEGPASSPATPTFSGPEEGAKHPSKPHHKKPRHHKKKHGKHHKKVHKRHARSNRGTGK